MENGSDSKRESFLSRMALNDNKAGMEGLDRDKINKIIMETSKGSRFYENEVKREKQVNQRIEKMMLQKAQITELQLKKAQAQVEKMVSELEESRDLSRVIVHVDMDAFYAAVEMRDCSELKDKPMAVGSMSMLSTSNYHARKYGVRAAMPGFIAKKLCPDLVIVPPNFDKYRAVSEEIREIFADYDPNFQPMSLDEAYLDFTDHLEQRQSWQESLRTHPYCSRNLSTDVKQTQPPEAEETDLSPILFEDSPTSLSPPDSGGGAGSAFEVFGTSVEEAVREMRFRIEQKTSLTASAGIAPNTMLAKVCSDKKKPNGQFRLLPTREVVMDFIQDLLVRKVCGIGKVSEKMLNALGITTCSHLGQQMALLSLMFSETSWHHYLRISLGLGSTYIPRHEERKSMSTERTFKELSKPEEQLSFCRELCEDLAEDLKKQGLKGKTVTLKLKNINFEVKTRAQTLPYAVATAEDVFAVAKDLLKMEIEAESPQPLRLRLMGVRISAFVSVDDKTPMQKSIIGFLQSGKTDCSRSTQITQPNPETEHPSIRLIQTSQPHPAVQNDQKQEKACWRSDQNHPEKKQTHDKPKQSFFQRAHAKRLQLLAANSDPHDEGHGEDTSKIGAFSKEGVESSTQSNKNNCVASENRSSSTVQAHALTSESLTCPVCFRQVETTDLNVFNRHVDCCLSAAARKPKEDSGEEFDLEDELPKGEAVHKQNGEQQSVHFNRVCLQEGQRSSKIHPDLKVSLNNGDNKPVTLPEGQSCCSKSPVLVCPVCHLTQDTEDLVVFNRHVDLCLNQEVLHELGGPTTFSRKPVKNIQTEDGGHQPQRQASKSKNKRRDTPSSPPSKKAKSLGLCNTIDKFFREVKYQPESSTVRSATYRKLNHPTFYSYCQIILSNNFLMERRVVALKTMIKEHCPKKEDLDPQKWLQKETIRGFTDFILHKQSDEETDGSFDSNEMLLETEKQFMEAAKRNDVEIMKRLGKGLNINARNVHHRTALHYAVAGKNIEAVQLLLQRRVKVDLKDKYGVAAVHLAAWFGTLEILKLLVQTGAEQKVENEEGLNIMHCAAINNHTEIVEYIINDLQMKELDKDDQSGRRPFALAAEHGCVDMLNTLMEPYNMATMNPNTRGDTPLHLAARNGHLDAVQLLLQSFDTRDEVNTDGETALYQAAENRQEECVQALLEAGCDPNILTVAKCSALHSVSEGGHTSLVQLLLKHGANTDFLNQHLEAPLHLAVKNSHIPVIHSLLASGCNIDITDKRSQTALHLAVELDRTDVVEMLLKAGVDLTLQDRQGKTALGVAARANEVIIVDMVIKAERYYIWRQANPELNESVHSEYPLTFKLDHRHGTKQLRSIAWRLAYELLKPGDWKRLAQHWGFTREQIFAIQEQWTDQHSYKEHGNRMLLIWLHGEELAQRSPSKELYQGLILTGNRKAADKLRMEAEITSNKSCCVS